MAGITVTPYGFEMGSTERQQLRFDFGPDLESGETLTGTPSVTIVNTQTGGDVSSTALDGTATINSTRVLQWVHALIAGQKYRMTVTVLTSDGELRAAEQLLTCRR